MATGGRRHVEVHQGKAHSKCHVFAVGSIDLATFFINDQGVIQNCSQTFGQVFGYRPDELAGRHISTLLPQSKVTELVPEDRTNSRLALLCHCAIPFQARHRPQQDKADGWHNMRSSCCARGLNAPSGDAC